MTTDGTTTGPTASAQTEPRALNEMIDALEMADGEALAGLLAQDVRLRASLPRRDIERIGPADAAAVMAGWFADATDITRLHSAVEAVGDVWRASYRFQLREAGEDLVAEQHAYATIEDGLITALRLICSGFRPAGAGTETEPDGQAVAETRLDALGEGCATLTPRIASAMRTLASGQLLAVLTDDPGAPGGIAAWSRMTGHAIVGTSAEPGGGTRYYLRHA